MKFNLFIQAFISDNPERMKELIECYEHNTKIFDKVYLICEKGIEKEYKLTENTKAFFIQNSRNFVEIFRFVGPLTESEDINVVANSDIKFDETIKLTKDMKSYECYALSRWNKIDGSWIPNAGGHSQDTWIFKGKIKELNVNFPLGVLGCDNRLAFEISKKYKISNPCLSIKTYHVHDSEYRTYTEASRLNHPYRFLDYCELKTETEEVNPFSIPIEPVWSHSSDISILTGDEHHSNVENPEKLVFKELAPFNEQKRVIPFPIISKTKDVQLIPISERKFDYCCIMNITGPVRQRVEGILNEYKKHKPNCVLDFACTRDNEEKHLETIRNSKICICPPTESSPETHRYADAAKLGCIIVCHKMPPFWYYNNKYEFQIPDWNLLPELLNRILSIPNEELETVSQTTRNYYDNYLSPTALNKHIKYFIERQEALDNKKINKIISYALWGNSPKYVVGAKKNIELAKKYFPDWKVHLYVSDKTEFEYESENLTIIRKKEEQSHEGLFWRFEPLDSDDIVIIRDLDDRLSERHKLVVDEWLESDKDLHVIRDHPCHTAHILGGLWGSRNGLLKGFKRAIQSVRDKSYYGSDEGWLSSLLWNPKYIKEAFIHDSFFKNTGLEHKIKKQRENYEFLGNVYDENDNMVEYWKKIKEYEDSHVLCR